jgi:hypothetical protein
MHSNRQDGKTAINPMEVPKLAPPGAGIPSIERWVGALIFGFKRWRGAHEKFTAEFVQARREIGYLCQGKSDAELSRRVLIPRLRGLEDSSRYWSVWMTLDHLRIVNREITRVIGDLTAGEVPAGAASTAAVKPSECVGPNVVEAYERSCDDLIKVVSAGREMRTRVRYAHPWFGPLDAAGWHAMSAMHMGIHKAQIDRILKNQSRRQS